MGKEDETGIAQLLMNLSIFCQMKASAELHLHSIISTTTKDRVDKRMAINQVFFSVIALAEEHFDYDINNV